MWMIVVLMLGIAAFVGAGWMAGKGRAPLAKEADPSRRRYQLAARWAIAFAALASLAYCATGFSWSPLMTGNELRAQMLMYSSVAVWGLIPYALLLMLSWRMEALPRLQVVLVGAVVLVAVAFFGYVRTHEGPIPSGGWEFLIVPALQMALIASVCLIGGMLVRFGAFVGRNDRR